jgi:hypothetical protein
LHLKFDGLVGLDDDPVDESLVDSCKKNLPLLCSALLEQNLRVDVKQSRDILTGRFQLFLVDQETDTVAQPEQRSNDGKEVAK